MWACCNKMQDRPCRSVPGSLRVLKSEAHPHHPRMFQDGSPEHQKVPCRWHPAWNHPAEQSSRSRYPSIPSSLHSEEVK